MNKKKIVIVEDDPFSQKFYQIILTRIGYIPIIVNNYDELFNTLECEAVSLLIMDINLKNSYIKDVQHDGRSLAKIIRSNEHYVEIPIIMITGFCSKVLIDALLGDKIADYVLPKPIDNINNFIDIINSYLAE